MKTNYCLGGTYNVEMANTGLTQCSTIENGAYPYSFESANATTKCYRQCVATDVAHATSASGEYYYGGENTCEATGCAVGWTLKSINLQSLYGNQTNSGTNVYAYMSGNTPQFGSPHDSILSISEAEKQYYGITDSSKWAVKLQDYDMGIIRGEGRCLSTSGTVGNTGTPSISSSGTKCWCGITSYIEPGGTRVYNFLSTTWVYKQDFNGMSGNNYEQSIVDCSSNCAMVCAVDVGSDNPTSEYRSKLRPNIFRNMVSTTICDGNSIAIDWYNDTVANNGIKIEVQEAAQQCTYSGTITIPDEQHTPSKTGYTFGGWKLRTNE